jgi:hypothetical protein
VLAPTVAARAPPREVVPAHAEVIAARRAWPLLRDPAAAHAVERIADAVVVRRRLAEARSVLVINLGPDPVTLAVVFDTRDPAWWPPEEGSPAPTRVADGSAVVGGLSAALLATTRIND